MTAIVFASPSVVWTPRSLGTCKDGDPMTKLVWKIAIQSDPGHDSHEACVWGCIWVTVLVVSFYAKRLKPLTFECAWLDVACQIGEKKKAFCSELKKHDLSLFIFWQVHFGELAVNQLCFFAVFASQGGWGMQYSPLQALAQVANSTVRSFSRWQASSAPPKVFGAPWQMKVAVQPSPHIGDVLHRRAKLIRVVETPGLENTRDIAVP